MAPNNNDSSGADDFVLIDGPASVIAVDDVYSNSPIKGGYVKIKTKKDHEKTLVNIQGFEPMLPSDFPDMMKQALFKAADPANNGPQDTAASPHVVLIKNATTLFECFFHFSGIQGLIGRYNIFALVGKACGLLDDDNFVTLQQYVGSVIQALSDARMPASAMPMEDGEAVANFEVEDPDTQRLVHLVDRYLEFEADEPTEVVENWCDNETVKALWTEWATMVEIRMLNASTEIALALSTDTTGDENAHLLAATSLSARKFQRALRCLQARRSRSDLTLREQLLVKKVLKYTTALTSELNRSYSQVSPADRA